MAASAPVEEVVGLRAPASEPRVSIGAPVYNGERFLQAALNSLLQQTFEDFELIISDNGSTDGTAEICRQAAAADPRVRYFRSDDNRGAAWNHNRVIELARGEYFTWASHDDLWHPQFVERCVAALDRDPTVVFARANAIDIDEEGDVLGREMHRCDCSSPSPSTRFWEMLIVYGGHNTYGLIRTSVLRRIPLHQTFPRAERTMFAELSLYGRFLVLPEDLFFKRRHSGQTAVTRASRRAESMALDPGRAKWWRHRTSLMLGEYVIAFARAVWRAPLERPERIRCYAGLARWVVSHVPGFRLRDARARSVEYDRTITQRLARVPW
jgi:glycosyltransferase involved in cell wall biosynthesis